MIGDATSASKLLMVKVPPSASETAVIFHRSSAVAAFGRRYNSAGERLGPSMATKPSVPEPTFVPGVRIILPPAVFPVPPVPAVKLILEPSAAAAAVATSTSRPPDPALISTSMAFNSISAVVEGAAACPTIIVRAIAPLPISMLFATASLPTLIVPPEEFISNALAASMVKPIPAFKATPPALASR